ncbi:MAG: hypothetical protein FJ011_23535, partial [Chloroflexi bacterium]|nr:hypothetical protein [Chloroflexota bacterium]
MTISYLDYPLERGYIHNWLTLGPQATIVPNLGRFTGADYKLQIAQHYHQPESGLLAPPAEGQSVQVDGWEARWNYVRCKDDHFVDLSVFHHECTYLRAWAYTELVSAGEQRAACVLTTNGPADVWVNGEHVHRQEHFFHQTPKRVPFELALKPGANAILVRMEEVAARECPYAMALWVVGAAGTVGPRWRGVLREDRPEPREPGALTVRLPTAYPHLDRRVALERALYAAQVRQDVFHGDQKVAFRWPDDFADEAEVTIRVEDPAGFVHGEAKVIAGAGATALLGKAYEFTAGAYDLTLMPGPEEFYIGNLRLQRKIRCWITGGRYAETPYGSFASRRREALLDAARRNENVFCEIAKMALGAWDDVDSTVVHGTIGRINRRGDCSDFYLVGLLGMAYRFAGEPDFPPELRQPLEDCILGFKYWHDEPGSDAMCYTTENHSILFHTCEVLAGQLYPDRVFTNTGETGQQHRAKGEQRALAWLRERGANGFKEWDSNCYFEEDTLALTHLAGLAQDDDVSAMATVLLDKMFFTMALNSFRGVFGSTHGRTYTQFIKSGYTEATAGMSRLLFGMGVFNSHVLGTVSLACSDYDLPMIIAQIAGDRPLALWNRERHAGELALWRDSGSHGVEVNKVTYKTPDFMLCSAQDWHPGEKGYQQHIWQATFGPDALVFVTHPVCASEDGSHRPNFWHGNDTLPRVAQWRDLLIAVHNLPEDDWMGFTHAFFPAFAFDDHDVDGRWAFGRKGDGYIALTASAGLSWMTTGDNAHRELRSYGSRNVWVCQMGRRATDGSFAAFKRKVSALPVAFDDLSVRLRSLRGDEIAFGWTGLLLLNGQEQPITGFKHYESPHCVADLPAAQMDLTFGENVLRL